jgi:predicted DNA-binding protein
MGASSMVMIEPPSVDVRIVNQYSFFSVIPNDMADIQDFLDKHTAKTVKYVIKKELRWQIRDMLDHQNISERIVYPGLDGLSKWLGRHYYVR